MVAWVVISRPHLRRSLQLRHGDKRACHAPQFSSFPFIYFRTLSFSVSCKSFVCHSYENCRVSLKQFPFWNSTLARPRTPFPMRNYLSLFFSYSCALFCTHQKCNSFVFKRFRTLCQKHPGWGVAWITGDGAVNPPLQNRRTGVRWSRGGDARFKVKG